MMQENNRPVILMRSVVGFRLIFNLMGASVCCSAKLTVVSILLDAVSHGSVPGSPMLLLALPSLGPVLEPASAWATAWSTV